MILGHGVGVVRVIFRAFPVIEGVSLSHRCFVNGNFRPEIVDFHNVRFAAIEGAAVELIGDPVCHRLFAGRRVLIRHGEACGRAAGDVDGIGSLAVGAGNHVCQHLINRVNHRRAVPLLIEMGENACPIVFGGEHKHISRFHAVGQQLDRHRIRTDTVVVVAVIPMLCDADLRLAGRIAVGHVEAVDPRGVVFHGIFGDRIGNSSAVVENGERIESPLPPVGFSDGLAGDFLPVGFQPDGDAVGTPARRVIAVVPCLCALDVLVHGRVGIGDGEAVAAGGDFNRVGAFRVHAGDHTDQHFLHRVLDWLAAAFGGKVGKRARPISHGGKHQRAAGKFAVRQQPDGHGIGTDVIGIRAVVPFFIDSDGCFACFVGVDDRIAVQLGFIALHGVFGNRVDNFRLSARAGRGLVAGKMGEDPFPFACLGGFDGADLLAVGQEVDNDLFGAQSVGVLTVVPCFLPVDSNGVRRVLMPGVRQREALDLQQVLVLVGVILRVFL